MPVTKKSKKSDPAALYGKVVDAAELQAVTLVNLNFVVQPQFFEKQADVSFGYDIDVVEENYDADTGGAIAIIDCAVYASINDEKLFNCEAKYIVVYALSETCDRNAVSSFLKRVSVFACYPYFRSIVASVDWAAGTRLPPMPVHRETNSVQARVANKSATMEAERLSED